MDFIGFNVKLFLKNNLLITGTICEVDLIDKSLSLKDVLVESKRGKFQKSFEKYKSNDIKDLELLPHSSEGPASPVARSASEEHQGKKKAKRRNKRNEEWAHEDVAKVKVDGDFDFQKNLQLFDKKKEFELIKLADETNPSDRLVSHNQKSNWKKLQDESQMRKLKYFENVLD